MSRLCFQRSFCTAANVQTNPACCTCLRPQAPVIPQATSPSPPAPNAPPTSGFLGTGHGGEFVFAVELQANADGASTVYNLLRDGVGPGLPLPPAGVEWAAGTSLIVTKRSQIGPFLTTAQVALDPTEGMLVSSNYTVLYSWANASHSKKVPNLVNFLYPMMTMFNEPFTVWIAACANGTMLSGTFQSDASFTLNADIRWAAVYDGAEHGAVYQYPNGHAYVGTGFKNAFWNRKYDHKLYFRMTPPSAIGEAFGFSHSVAGFSAAPSGWEAAARALVRGW
jgi:hypothetical protein